MRVFHDCRRSLPALAGLILLGSALVGCGSKNLSEADLLSKLEAGGLTVERLDENLITYEQLQRIEANTVAVFSVKLTESSGQDKSVTLVQFDRDWKATAVADEGVPGFAVLNWYVVGAGISETLRDQIEAALL